MVIMEVSFDFLEQEIKYSDQKSKRIVVQQKYQKFIHRGWDVFLTNFAQIFYMFSVWVNMSWTVCSFKFNLSSNIPIIKYQPEFCHTFLSSSDQPTKNMPCAY